MSEYIIDIPDDCILSINSSMYFPDERDEPMPITRIVRCKDCAWVSSYKRRNPVTGKLVETVYNCSGHFWEPEGLNEVEPDGFCAWGERTEEC